MIFVDPGLGGTGWASFPIPGGAPNCFGVLRGGKGPWETQAHDICQGFIGVLNALRPKAVVMEFPTLWSGDMKSFTSASRGDLFKLSYLIGGLAEAAWECCPQHPKLITPQEWKGQLPKEVVIKRILREWPDLEKIPNHAADAVGMGLAAQGKL